MKEIIKNFIENNFAFYEKNKITVEVNSYSDNGNYDVFIFSRKNKVAGIELYENSNGIFIRSDNRPEINFHSPSELDEIFELIKYHFKE